MSEKSTNRSKHLNLEEDFWDRECQQPPPGIFFFNHEADKRSPAVSDSFISCIEKCLLGNKQYTKNWTRTKNAAKHSSRIHTDGEENNLVFPFALNLINPVYRICMEILCLHNYIINSSSLNLEES